MDPKADTIAAEAAENETRLKRGDLIGRYELVRMLGEGGMGAVWEARHVEIGKRVAIKFLFPQLASDPTFVERFRREAMATANLDHPNICRALDFLTQDEHTVLVLDFVEGMSLAEKLEHKPKLPIHDAIEIVGTICDGLQAAHDIGIVHRDLKPENVMLSGDAFNKLKILDFGIAASHGEEDQRLTNTGQAIGTPTYMSPEQIATRGIGPASDQYALGVVLFELLAGRAPFQSEISFEILEAHVRTPAPDVREFRPDVSGELAAIVARLLEKKSDDRFASVRDVAKALRSADLTPGDGLVPNQPSGSRPKDIGSKRNVIVAVSVGLILAGVLSFSAIYYFAIGGEKNRAEMVEKQKRSFLETRRDALAPHDVGSLPLIEKALLEKPTDPHLKSAHGIKLVEQGMIAEGLDAFADAAKVEPRYLGFDPLIETFKSCMRAKDCSSADDRGWDLSLYEAATLRNELFDIATTSERSKQRKLAFSVLEKFSGLNSLESWQTDALTLVNGKGCEERTAAIKRLAKVDHDRARSVLRTMSDRPKRGCGLLDLKDCIACLRQPLADALKTKE